MRRFILLRSSCFSSSEKPFSIVLMCRSRSFSIFVSMAFPLGVMDSTVALSSLGSDFLVRKPLFSSLFAIPVMFAPGTSMIRLTLVILLCPFFEASSTRRTLYCGKVSSYFLKAAETDLLKTSAILTTAIRTFSSAHRSL